MAARSMELILRTEGIGEAAGLLSRIGPAARESAGPMARIGRLVKELGDASPVTRIGAAAQEAAGQFQELATQLTAAAQAYREVGRASREAGRLRPPGARTAGDQGAEGVDAPAASGARRNTLRFIKGPNQRLAEIAAQRQVLPEVPDETWRKRIGQDLDRAERLATRSVFLDQQRVNKPELQTGPGLLELFQDLNALLRGAARGDVGAVGQRVRNLGFNIQHILPPDEKPGGLNILQRLKAAERSRINAGATPSLNDFALPGSHGPLSEFNLPGTAKAKIGNSRVLSLANAFGASLGRAVPALGKVATMAGPMGAVAVGVGAVAAGAMAAAGGLFLAYKGTEAFIDNLNQATGHLRSFGASAFLSGGSGRDISRLQAMGIPGGDIPGISAGLRERLSSDPSAMGVGVQLGIGTQTPRAFGSTNEAGLLVKTIDALRASEEKAAPVVGRLRAQEETLRRARTLGIETAMELTRVSERVWQSMKRDAKTREEIFDPATQQAARDYEAGIKRIGQGQENLRSAFAKPWMSDAAQVANAAADVYQFVSLQIGRSGGAIRRVGQEVAVFAAGLGGPFSSALAKSIQNSFNAPDLNQAFGSGLILLFGGAMNSLLPGSMAAAKVLEEQWKRWSGRDGKDDAVDAHTKAMIEHAKALRAGMTGGGHRANAAVPDRYKGWHMDQAAQGNRARYGGVTL